MARSLGAAKAAPSPWTQPSPAAAREGRRGAAAVKREAVLRAAAQLFNDKGYHATSLDMVAQALSVTKPTLYYYVKSKDEILYECVRLGLELMREAIAQAARSGGSALDKLKAGLRQYALIVTMDFGMCLIRVGEDPLGPESRRKLRRLKGQLDHELRALIEQGVAEGSLAPCDPKLAGFTLGGALSWIGRWYDPAGPWSAEEVADHTIALLMTGLAQRRATSRSPARRMAA